MDTASTLSPLVLPYLKEEFLKKPQYGDLVVFKTPSDNRTDYIKRVIGLPGDQIQFINGNLFLNDNQIFKKEYSNNSKIMCGKK